MATWDLIRKYPPDTKLIFVGDATMSPYEILQPGGSVEYNNEELGQLGYSVLLRISQNSSGSILNLKASGNIGNRSPSFDKSSTIDVSNYPQRFGTRDALAEQITPDLRSILLSKKLRCRAVPAPSIKFTVHKSSIWQ